MTAPPSADVEQPILNPTGKPIAMTVPLKDGTQVVGDIDIRIEPDSAIAVSRAGLVGKLRPLLTGDSQVKLDASKEADGMVALSTLQSAGIGLKFNSSAMELLFEPTADQRPVTELSITRSNYTGGGREAATSHPAFFSGFFNVFGGADHRWADRRADPQTSARLDIESAVRLGNIVLENWVGYDGRVDTFICPAEAQCGVEHRAGLKRRYSRAVYDLPDKQLRLTLGDTGVSGSSLQAAPDFLGVRLDHAPRTFSPGASLRPTGRSTLRIERTSDVDVMINGVVIQRFQLRPGVYNIADLPLQAGLNSVELVVTDDTGERRTLSYTAFSDAMLLAPGRMEWSIGGGLPSFMRDNDRHYLANEWMGSMFARIGLTDFMTGEVNFQADNSVRLGGMSLYTGTPVGFLTLQGALSDSLSGFGYSALATYDLSNFKGLSYAWSGLRDSFRASVEYRSSNFRTPGEFQSTASGILVPQYNYSWRFQAAYSMPITSSLSATLSGRYQIGNDEAFKVSPLTVSRNRYGVDLTLSAPVNDWITGSLSVGWGNDSLLRDAYLSNRDDPEFRVGVRVTIRPGETSRVNARYDTRYDEAAVTASTYSQKGYQRWDASADLHRYSLGDTTAAAGSVGYVGNRGEARLTHTTGVRGSNGAWEPGDNRTSLRAGTSIAFADGQVAIGAPVRGNGFAIVHAHESIAGKPITVGDREAPRAVTDGLGPALIGNLPSYALANLPVDVEDLPVGYSLGEGGFSVFPSYRAGYSLQVGSAYSVSVFGTLHNAKGEPVGLVSGTARSSEHPSKEVAIFTNATGRFGADGLAPGRWTIEMATEGAPTHFVLDVPKAADGLFKAGTLRPAGQAATTGPWRLSQ